MVLYCHWELEEIAILAGFSGLPIYILAEMHALRAKDARTHEGMKLDRDFHQWIEIHVALLLLLLNIMNTIAWTFFYFFLLIYILW